jgi:hypothetical protein
MYVIVFLMLKGEHRLMWLIGEEGAEEDIWA